jgi:hypothetical protein
MPAEMGLNQSIAGQHGTILPEMDWKDVKEPGCYVDQDSGELFRFPAEALVAGMSPIIIRESSRGCRLRQLSADPFMATLKARFLCAQHNIKPNF